MATTGPRSETAQLDASGAKGSPRASVVVATRNRRVLLERLLDALEAQSMPRSSFEIVVVDDGSSDGTERLLADRAADRRVRTIRLDPGRGPAAARNAGARAATGEIIAFTDDDCLPDPRWLESGLGAFAPGVGIVQGATRADRAAADFGKPFSRTMEVVEDDGHYPTCNIFYRREALERAGGFDETFRFACGEDTDLAWRVIESGQGARFCPAAVVVHVVRPPSFRLFLKERRRFADQILVVKRHPALRRFYYRRYFYQRSHVHAAVTVALLAASLLIGPGFALLLPLVWIDRFRHTRLVGSLPRRAGLVVQLLVGDVWELLVFCYWSMRYRSILI